MAARLFSLSLLFVTQANQTNLIHALQTGTFPERLSALSQIAQIPPAERTEPLWLALAQALQDEQAENHRETDALLAQPQVPVGGDERDHGEARSEYLHQLILELAKWHDPRELPALTCDTSSASRRNAPVTPISEPNKAPPKAPHETSRRPSNSDIRSNPIVLNVAIPKPMPMNKPTPLPLIALHDDLDMNPSFEPAVGARISLIPEKARGHRPRLQASQSK